MTKLILASQSPRRQELLKGLGLPFDVIPADIDETPLDKEIPKEYVQRVCLAKAQEVASENPNCTVLAADTICTIGRRIIGKPENKNEASKILQLMSGRRQRIYTAICVIDSKGKIRTHLSENKVKIIALRKKDIQKYVEVEENWQGKAGGFNLNVSTGGALVDWMQGTHSSVIGLPLAKTVNLLRACGYDL